MKSLSSSRREVLVDCFHVHACHISHLLPGGAVRKHSSRPFDNLRGHHSATTADYPLLLGRGCRNLVAL
nr:MAG TPA: hypothetical protein [Caudoviricetes sp.]